ncbi:MAG: DegT/DnrJ/EryC1/StrS aminotransferase family protein, partial [Pseudomonadota bacterium]
PPGLRITGKVISIPGESVREVSGQKVMLTLSPCKAYWIGAGQNLNPKVVMPVDLFGQPADYDSIAPIAKENGMKVLCDAAQSYGAEYKDHKIGSIGDATATSFFPAKPLGCYGDGGAIFTQDDELNDILKSLRVHGKGTDKYDNVRIGMNGRMDTMQAAILLEKLKIFQDELKVRQEIADNYSNALSSVCQTPHVINGAKSAWAQYTIQIQNRDALAQECKNGGVPTAIYYPKPMHEQTAYKRFGHIDGGLPVSDSLSKTVLSLPMHPYMEQDTQNQIIDVVISSLKQEAA